ncbi:riboflavin biosynthesis protein RibF [Verrucomicrobiaceae bacterium 227]
MHIYSSLAELAESESGFGLALGVFDGVHLGHQAVIEAARGFGKVGVLTFDPHPVQVLAPGRAPRRILANLEHKKRILDAMGLDFMVVMEFTKEFAGREARDFGQELLACGAVRLSAGEDWSFGKARSGNMTLLAEWGRDAGVEVAAVKAVSLEGGRISSTRIRACLQNDDLGGASRLLGRPYSVFGEVVKGRQLGRTIGVPTANVAVSEEQLPPNGVYRIEGNGIAGVANIGTRPTVDDSGRRSLEVHLFSDEVPDSYGWWLEVGFLAKIRDERKFASIEELKAQIFEDIAHAKGELPA